MPFNELILEKIAPTLIRYGFELVEQHKGHLEFLSDKVRLVISHDPREASQTFWVGRPNEPYHEIRDGLITAVLKSDITLENLPTDQFIQNLQDLLRDHGHSILTGDRGTLNAIEAYVNERSKIYTAQILTDQALANADKAWAAERYMDFLKYLGEIDLKSLPESYQLKREMAMKKLAD